MDDIPRGKTVDTFINSSNITTNQKLQMQSSCRCGINSKNANSIACRSTANPGYRSRCPCLKNSSPCKNTCHCKNCGNPYGSEIVQVKSSHESYKPRLRECHSQYQHASGKEFVSDAINQGCGKWSNAETALLYNVYVHSREGCYLRAPTKEAIFKTFNEAASSELKMQFGLGAIRNKTKSQIVAKLSSMQ